MWLGNVPEYTAGFVRIMFIVALLWPLRGAMIDAIHATGDIKKFQIYEGTSFIDCSYCLSGIGILSYFSRNCHVYLPFC